MRETIIMSFPIYLDYNGTTPHAPEVVEAMRPFLETAFGNPSSSHWYGEQPKQAVETARQQVAGLINCRPNEVFFTSGGTESNNHAISGMARALKRKGRHIITSAFEHPAVFEVCHHLKNQGFETTFVRVDQQGMVDPKSVEQAIGKETVLITIMHANNEVGTVQPISDIAQIAKSKGIVLHTDAAQSLGKIPVDVDDLGVDLVSVAGHKLYAPKGVGALYVRQGIRPEKFCHGAGQEGGWRAGTENVLEIVGLGKACEIAMADLTQNMAHMKAMRDRLQIGITRNLEEVRLNGDSDSRLPNTLSLAFKGLDANSLLGHIGSQVAASPGAACHSDTLSISHVLEAMRVPMEWAKGTVRFSVGRMTCVEEIDRAISVIVQAVHQLRSKS